MISPIFSSYQGIPQQNCSEGDGLSGQEKGPHDDQLVPGFELDHLYQRENISGIYVEDIVSALHIQLPDTTSKRFVSFKSLSAWHLYITHAND